MSTSEFSSKELFPSISVCVSMNQNPQNFQFSKFSSQFIFFHPHHIKEEEMEVEEFFCLAATELQHLEMKIEFCNARKIGKKSIFHF